MHNELMLFDVTEALKRALESIADNYTIEEQERRCFEGGKFDFRYTLDRKGKVEASYIVTVEKIKKEENHEH